MSHFQSLIFYQELQYWWFFFLIYLPFRNNSVQSQKLCLGTKRPGCPRGLDYGQESGQTSVGNKGKGIVMSLQSCDTENLGRFPLLLPQTAGPYSSFVNHCLLYTKLQSTYSNQNGVNHLVLMYLLIFRFCKSHLPDSGEGSLHSTHLTSLYLAKVLWGFHSPSMLLVACNPSSPRAFSSHVQLYQPFLDFFLDSWLSFFLTHHVPGSLPHLSAICTAKCSLTLCASLLILVLFSAAAAQ